MEIKDLYSRDSEKCENSKHVNKHDFETISKENKTENYDENLKIEVSYLVY